MLTRILGGLVAVLLALLLLSTPALAQEDGVTIDPGPADREYAIPLDEARKGASPSPRSRRSGGDEAAPLFGAGVGRSGSNGGSAAGPGSGSGGGETRGASRRGGSSRDRSSDGSTPAPASSGRDRDRVRRLAASAGTDGAGFSGSLTIGIIAGVLLLVATGAGLLLRRRSTT